MWMLRNICRECWDLWRPNDTPQSIGGVFSNTCEICGKNNHNDIFIRADEKYIRDLKEELDRKRPKSPPENLEFD